MAGTFTAEPGYATWREHGTCDWELICTSAGSGRTGAPGGDLRLDPGTLLLIRPGTRHDYGPWGQCRWAVAWVHFLPPERWLPLLDWPEPAPGLLLQRVPSALQAWLLAQWDELARWSLGALPLHLELAQNLLEAMLLRIGLASAAQHPQRDELVAEIIARLGADLAAPLDRAALARSLGLSVSRLAHRFSAATGLGLAAFQQRLRLQRACVLLDATARPIAEIAAELGFDDPLYFSARFRRFTGLGPRAWRQRDRSQPTRQAEEPPGNRAW